MAVTVVAVGRLKAGPHAALCAEYAKRLPWPLEIREVEERRRLAGDELKAREGALLLAALPKNVLLVALDEHGTVCDSAEFARKFAGWRQSSGDNLAFAVGGADGLSAEVLARARARIAFGTMTWPHALARVMLLEQIYRAHTILAGHPYHRP